MDWKSEVPISGDLDLMAALHATGQLLTDDLPEVATQALVAGHNSPSLRQLAGSTSRNAFELQELFARSLQELAVRRMDHGDALRVLARHVAEQIVRGDLPPGVGAARLWRLFIPDYPEEVMPFLQLDDMYQNSYYADQKDKLADEIVEEAKRYLGTESPAD